MEYTRLLCLQSKGLWRLNQGIQKFFSGVTRVCSLAGGTGAYVSDPRYLLFVLLRPSRVPLITILNQCSFERSRVPCLLSPAVFAYT